MNIRQVGVGMGHYQCPVCLEETSVVVVDTQLKFTPTIEGEVGCVGHELCDTHAAQNEEGYLFFIELADAPKGQLRTRTGRLLSIKEDVTKHVFDSSVELRTINYMDVETLELVQKIYEKNLEDNA